MQKQDTAVLCVGRQVTCQLTLGVLAGVPGRGRPLDQRPADLVLLVFGIVAAGSPEQHRLRPYLGRMERQHLFPILQKL